MKIKAFLFVVWASNIFSLSACSISQQTLYNKQKVNVNNHIEQVESYAVTQESTRDFNYSQNIEKNNDIFLGKMKAMEVPCETWVDLTTEFGIVCKNPTIYHKYYTVPSLHAVFQAPLSPIVSGSFLTPERESELVPQVKNNKIYAIDKKYQYLADEIIAHNYSIEDHSHVEIKDHRILREKWNSGIKYDNDKGESPHVLWEYISYWEIKENPEQLSFAEIVKKETGSEPHESSSCFETLTETSNKGLQCYENIYYKSWYKYYYRFHYRIMHINNLTPWIIPPIQLFLD